jgi:hypothetical protein
VPWSSKRHLPSCEHLARRNCRGPSEAASPWRTRGVLAEREVLVSRLKQGIPGQLGKLARRMAEAGVKIEVQYSDHNHQLILVVDNLARGRAVSEEWDREATRNYGQSPR